MCTKYGESGSNCVKSQILNINAHKIKYTAVHL